MDAMAYNLTQENPVLIIAGADISPLFVLVGSIGDFYYVTFEYDADIPVVLFKYKKPKDPNTDGAIYQITHKNISFLLFEDFDDLRGIKNLLNAFTENEKRQNELQEQHSILMKYIYEWNNLSTVLDYLQKTRYPKTTEGPDRTIKRTL
jgi:hypothetical protein